MIRLTICDDSKRDISAICAALAHYEQEKEVKLNISAYSSPENLLLALGDGELADVYVLDVSMPGTDGFTLADEIRSHSETAVIIFLTSMEDQAAMGYKSRALRYVSKLNLEKGLPEALDAARAELEKQRGSSVLLRRYSDWQRVPLREIVSVTRVARQLNIATVSMGVLTDNRGISEFFDALGDDRFLFIDRSCFVNIDYISSLRGDSLTMTDGSVLPVSRRAMQQVKKALIEHS